MEHYTQFLIRATIYLFLFSGAYLIFFRKQVNPVFNRAYLLLSGMAALLLALIPYNTFRLVRETQNILFTAQLPEVVLDVPATITETGSRISSSLSHSNLFTIIYIVISSMLFLLLLWRIVQIIRLVQKHKRIRHFGMIVVLLPANNVPFSFFNWVFIPEDLYRHQHYDKIMIHERAHYLKLHSLDVIFFEFFKVFLWFHPAVYFMRYEARTLHEYEADNLALRHFNKTDYQQTLLACSMAGQALSITNPFNVSPLKKRIMKMNQETNASHNLNWIKLGILLPFIAVAILVQSCYNEQPELEPIQPISSESDELDMDIQQLEEQNDTIFNVVEVMPKFPGGPEAMMKFIVENINYPELAKIKGIEGRVFVNFIVETDGSVSNANVLRGIGGGCDEEALRVVEMMPRWTPGYQSGQAVRVSFNLPVRFMLD